MKIEWMDDKMKQKKRMFVLVLFIGLLSAFAALIGIFSNGGPGPYEYQSIRGETVMIYGQGIYQHMSLEVAPQGIAQDVVTLLLGLPFLIISFLYTIKGSVKARLVFAGTLGYFFVTYLFYMLMGMYNHLFIVYVLLTSLSFFALLLTLFSFVLPQLKRSFENRRVEKFVGGFLMFNAVMIGALWLSVILPPLLNKELPLEVEHYTSLVVQGLDLSILLPSAFLSGFLLIKRNLFGYLLAPVYINFLVLLMTALSAKIIGISLMGGNPGPAIIIIPVFNILTILCSILYMKSMKISREGEYMEAS